MIKIEPHFLGAFLASEAAYSVLINMPHTDFVEDLKELIAIQIALMSHMIEGKHYGSDNIAKFIKYTQAVKEDMTRMYEERQ